jgi:hypothetical protein
LFYHGTVLEISGSGWKRPGIRVSLQGGYDAKARSGLCADHHQRR